MPFNFATLSDELALIKAHKQSMLEKCPHSPKLFHNKKGVSAAMLRSFLNMTDPIQLRNKKMGDIAILCEELANIEEMTVQNFNRVFADYYSTFFSVHYRFATTDELTKTEKLFRQLRIAVNDGVDDLFVELMHYFSKEYRLSQFDWIDNLIKALRSAAGKSNPLNPMCFYYEIVRVFVLDRDALETNNQILLDHDQVTRLLAFKRDLLNQALHNNNMTLKQATELRNAAAINIDAELEQLQQHFPAMFQEDRVFNKSLRNIDHTGL